MTEAINTPGSDATPGGNGLDVGGEGQTSPDAPIDAGTESASADEANQVRISKRDHENLKAMQSRYDSLFPKLGDLGPLVEQHGGQAIMDMLTQYNTFVSDPQMAEVMENFRSTGQVALPNAGSEDEYVDPEIKSLREQITGLSNTLSSVTGQLQGLNQTQGMRQISDFTDKFLTDYPMTDEQKERYASEMESRIGRLQPQQIQGMTEQTHRMLSLDAIEKDRTEIERRRFQQQSEQRQTLATDAGRGVATHGAESAADIPQPRNAQDLKRMAGEIMREAIRKSGG